MRTIDVILRDTSTNVGIIKSVKPGYARYLIAQKKALPKTKTNQKQLEVLHQQLAQEEAEQFAQAQAQAAKLNQVTIEIHSRATDEKRLYGSLGSKEIAEAIAKTGVSVNKKVIEMPHGPIHQLGDYEVVLRLHPKVTATVTARVIRTTHS